MRNIGFLFNEHIFPTRHNANKSPQQKKLHFQSFDEYMITQLPPPKSQRKPEPRLLTEFTLDDEQLRKLQINLELNKFNYNRESFVHTNITKQIEQSKELKIPDGMFHKAEEIDPGPKPKKKILNKLIAKQVLQESGFYYNLDKSLQYKFNRSPSALIRKEHRNMSPKERRKSPIISPVSNTKKEVQVNRRVYKQSLRQQPPQKKNMSIKVVENFEEGHARFSTLVQSAARMVGKYRI